MFHNIQMWMNAGEAKSYVSEVILSPSCNKRTRDQLSSGESDTVSPPRKMQAVNRNLLNLLKLLFDHQTY